MNSLRWLAIFSVSLHTAFCVAGGDETHNGGGTAEQNFTFAWVRLEPTLLACQKIGCAQNSSERALVSKLLSAQKQEAPELLFLKSTEHPEMFPHRTDGWPESISTGDSVGAPIYVAQDEIYVGSAPFSLAQAMETLIYGLSEHHTKAAEVVTPLAQRLGRLVSQNVSSVDEAALGQQQIRALIWNFQPYPAQIAIVDTQRQLEVTGLITRALICPTGFEPTPDFHLYNTVWGDLPPWDAHNQVQPLDLISDITFQCLSRSSSLIFTASLSIVIYFEPFQNGVIHRDPNWRSLGGLELRLSAEPTESNPEVIITNVRPLNAEDH